MLKMSINQIRGLPVAEENGLGGEGRWNWALSIADEVVDEVVEIIALYCICHYFGSGILILPTSAKPDLYYQEKRTQCQGNSNYKCSPQGIAIQNNLTNEGEQFSICSISLHITCLYDAIPNPFYGMS